jgi:hypothetical protein
VTTSDAPIGEPKPAPETPARAPLTALEMWKLSIAGAVVVLFALAAIAIAFDVPALRHALDLRRAFR